MDLQKLTDAIKTLEIFEEKSHNGTMYQRVPNGLVLTKSTGYRGELAAVFVPVDDTFFIGKEVIEAEKK